MNIERAEQILEELAAHGVQEICLCAGQRNSPFVITLEKTESFRTFSFSEERSAAFFALGRARNMKASVAVITTSGTAVAELLPATIEAFYSGVPLVLVTADRPRKFRGTGAPQCIEQAEMLSPYVRYACDLETEPLSLATWKGDGPAHLNVCFEEPLLDGVSEKRAYHIITKNRVWPEGNPKVVHDFLKAHTKPLVVLGVLDPQDISAVRTFLLQLRAPIYVEAHSGLREDPELSPFILRKGGGILREGGSDAILRIGSVPTARFWRDVELKWKHLPVLSISRQPFSGLARQRELLCTSLSDFFPCLDVKSISHDFSELFRRDREGYQKVSELFQEEPFAEPSMFANLSKIIPENSHVYLGNSLPIREWDLAATYDDRNFFVTGNRGANGIDGQLSTFFGLCESGREHWAIIGDLTALYDLAGPWVIPQLDSAINFRIVVVNNGGGMIFKRFSENPLFLNRHEWNFEHWAKMWEIYYERWENIPLRVPDAKRMIIELLPDEAATTRFWEKYDRLWRS